MTAYQVEKILSKLEADIRKQPLAQPEPVSGDRWLLSSCLQKSIRFNSVESAQRAAVGLWYQDRLSFWRRLHIVCLDDIGVASPDVVVAVLTATASPVWRRRVGDLRVALYLVRLLCQSTKTRIADELFLQAERASTHNKLREHFSSASNNLLADYVTDENCSLVERALALWYLAGTKKFTTDLMPQRKGSLELAAEVLRSLPAPTDLVESCVMVMGKTKYPLVLFSTLCWLEVEKQRSQLQVQENIIPATLEMEGLPYYSADVYTRVGQSCYRQLQKAVPELQRYGVRQIGVAVFYLEGGLLDKVITSPFLDDFCLNGELADAEGVGLPAPDYLDLRDCLAQHLPLLEIIRTEQLHRYLNGTV